MTRSSPAQGDTLLSQRGARIDMLGAMPILAIAVVY